jgi:hypothetical protein
LLVDGGFAVADPRRTVSSGAVCSPHRSAWASAAFSSPPMARIGRFRCGEGDLRIGPQDLAAGPPSGSAAGALTRARI